MLHWWHCSKQRVFYCDVIHSKCKPCQHSRCTSYENPQDFLWSTPGLWNGSVRAQVPCAKVHYEHLDSGWSQSVTVKYPQPKFCALSSVGKKKAINVTVIECSWLHLQVLAGDIEEAICCHAFYYALWQKYQALPERYNWQLRTPEILFYPLRPELVESTYILYQATKNPFYLHVGRDIIMALNNHTKVK